MTQYQELQGKKKVTVEGNAPKKLQKELILERSHTSLTSRLKKLDDEKKESEDNAQSVRDTLINQLKMKRDKAIQLAESFYQNSLSFANGQYKQMMDKASRVYENKKSLLQTRKESVKGELDVLSQGKSSPEIFLDQQEEKLLQQMQSIIDSIRIGRYLSKDDPEWYLSMKTKDGFGFDPIPNLPKKGEDVFETEIYTPPTIPPPHFFETPPPPSEKVYIWEGELLNEGMYKIMVAKYGKPKKPVRFQKGNTSPAD
jgi:hypothetical protein